MSDPNKSNIKYSQDKYNKKAPPVYIRLPRPTLDKLKEKEELTGLTRSELLRGYLENVGKLVEEISKNISMKNWSSGYERGYHEAKSEFGYTFTYGDRNRITVFLPAEMAINFLCGRESYLGEYSAKIRNRYLDRKKAIESAVGVNPSIKNKRMRKLTQYEE